MYNNKSKPTIEEYISKIEETLTRYELEKIRLQKIVNSEYQAPEYRQFCSKQLSQQEIALQAQTKRLETLQKIQDEQPITQDAHEQLLAMEIFKRDSIIAGYPNLIIESQNNNIFQHN